MAKQRLTDRTITNNVSLTDLIHIVKTGDTSQNPAGSSYATTIQNVVDTLSASTVTGLTFNNFTYDLSLSLDNGVTFNSNLSILASDIKVTGGTYNPYLGEITFVNNSGGTFVVSGISSNFLSLTGGTVTGPTNFTNGLSANTISTTTLFVNGVQITGDTYVTGGTYSNGNILFTNNQNNTFQVTGLTDNQSLSNILFVDPNGNDITAVKGDIGKPYQNLYSAKNAATSGDIIYVFPGTWTYDNRNTAGNPYNGQIDTLVNLWKDGVSYYFSPNTNVVFFNQTVTGQDMYLFKSSGNGGTCTVRGSLKFSGDSIGVDSFNGSVNFFNAGIGDGYTFDCEVKSLISKSPLLNGGTNSIVGQTAIVKITADEISYTHLGNNVGQSGAGAAILCRTPANIQYFLNIRKVKSTYYRAIQFRDLNTSSSAILNIDYLENLGGNGAIVCEINQCPNIYVNINKCDFIGYPYQSSLNSSTFRFVANANWYEVGDSGVAQKFQSFSNSNGVSIFNGTYNFKFNRILFENRTLEKMYFSGNVNVETANFTNIIFYNIGSGEINFNGTITGNFQGVVARPRTGKINIKNSTILPSITGGTFISNDTTTTGTTVISNTSAYFNSSSNLVNGQYVKNYFLNSNIKNLGLGDIFVNTTNTGTLQIHNSALQSVSGSTIDITGSSPLTISSTVSNTDISALIINGTVTVLTELDLI